MTRQPERLRRNVNRLNRLVTLLQKRGVAFSDMHILTVVGRRTGALREVPVSVLRLAGARYIFQAYPKSAWVANVRASPTVTLARGRRSSVVRMVELPVEERRSLLRDHVANSPAKLDEWFVKTGLIEEATPEALAAAAERIAIFRVEPT
ncbi:nitroreductase family deazaflavin-dependent oxidoreductase [Nocardia suismassiliense]|uniref:nitroreductase family deazaflavin-dependent oxidoreductase n=1 Tax=Nocardia suismassiliense TaxID=2077092 RepID=UPI000D1DF8BA|nr:nitroreductase family deazaflavin-dependent oxidoreductase [Nocardia suismassiliense]